MSVFSPDVNIDSPIPLPIDGGNPNPVVVSGSITVLNASIPVTGTFWQAVQPVSGTFWQAIQPVSGTVTVSNPGLTDTQLRATPVPVSGTITANQGTSPWVVSGTVTTSPNVNVHDGAGNTIASTGTSLNVDVTNTIPVTGTFWQAIQPVSGSVSVSNFPATVAVTQSTSPWVVSGTVTANLGTLNGAATAANQATEITNQGTLITDLGSIISNQTNGTQVVSVSNFPADADALAQGSTTAGQLGALEMGAVTTNPPVYVTGTTRPLSIDTAGNLRVYVENPAAALTSSSDTVVQITSTGANQVLLAANLNRKKAILYFESGIWNVKFGVGASATSKTYMVSTGNTTIEVLIWLGEIDAICTTSGKLVDVTEMV